MATPYEDIYKRFYRKIEDKDLVQFDENEQEEMLTGWLDTAISYIELEGLSMKNDLSDRDNDLQNFNQTLENYEIEVVAKFMVVAWYEPKINSLEHTLLMVGSKDEKWTSQKDHLEMMTTTRDKEKREAIKLVRNYGYKNNSYLSGE